MSRFLWYLTCFAKYILLQAHVCPSFRRTSETPTTTTSQKKYRNTPPICIAIRLQFVLEHFWCPYTLRKGNTASTPPICIAVRPPFVLQYASHLYRSTFGKILVVVVTGMLPTLAPSHQWSSTQPVACWEGAARMLGGTRMAEMETLSLDWRLRGAGSLWNPQIRMAFPSCNKTQSDAPLRVCGFDHSSPTEWVDWRAREKKLMESDLLLRLRMTVCPIILVSGSDHQSGLARYCWTWWNPHGDSSKGAPSNITTSASKRHDSLQTWDLKVGSYKCGGLKWQKHATSGATQRFQCWNAVFRACCSTAFGEKWRLHCRKSELL